MLEIVDGVCQVVEDASGTVDLTMAFEDVDAFAAMNFAVAPPASLIDQGRLDISDRRRWRGWPS